jgi:integrase/recombinase XerD
VQLCESGKDIHNVMLILMTYMGHQSIAATNKYVRIVETMFPEIVRQVDMTHNHIFPNMDEMTD